MPQHGSNARALPVWRSMMYVPINVDKYVDKAHTRGADAVILDLEDSIPAAEKDEARKLVPAAAKRVSRGGADVVVRINQPLRLAVRDIEAAIGPDVLALQLPKIDSASHIRLLSDLVDELEIERGMVPGSTRFVPMIETADAFFRAQEIATASPRNASVVLGGEDFAMELGMLPSTDAYTYPKQHVLIAARAAGLTPLGILGTVADFTDHAAVRETIRTSRRFGFEGASCIHPGVVPLLNEEFTPSEKDVASARGLIAAYNEAIKTGRASLVYEGKMIDVPVVRRAQNMLDRYEAIRARQATAAMG